MENKKDLKEKKISYLDITIFLIVIIIFGLGLLALYPGLITSDGVDQLSQAITGEYIDAHPPLHSLIVGGLYKLFGFYRKNWITWCFKGKSSSVEY